MFSPTCKYVEAGCDSKMECSFRQGKAVCIFLFKSHWWWANPARLEPFKDLLISKGQLSRSLTLAQIISSSKCSIWLNGLVRYFTAFSYSYFHAELYFQNRFSLELALYFYAAGKAVFIYTRDFNFISSVLASFGFWQAWTFFLACFIFSVWVYNVIVTLLSIL